MELENKLPGHVLSFAALGAVSAILQVVALREAAVAGNGSDTVVGSLLAVWLVLTAAGALLGQRWSRTGEGAAPSASLLFGLLSLAGLLSVVVLRALPAILAPHPGMELTLPAIVTGSSAALALPCLILGALFPACLARARESASPGPALRGYATEAAGFLLGGVLAALLLWCGLRATVLAALASAVALTAALLPVLARGGARWAWALLPTALAGAAFPLAPPLDRVTRGWKHPGEEVVRTMDTRHGVFTITEREGRTSFYYGGSPAWNSEDVQRTEEVVHLALLAHGAPRTVVLLSGSTFDLLAEALEHGPASVECVSLDPAPHGVGSPYLPERLQAAARAPQARFLGLDGRRFLDSKPSDSVDAFLVDMPDPSTALLNRYYTVEFFRDADRALKGDGILALTLSASRGYTPAPALALFEAVAVTLARVFPHVAVLETDGGVFLFLASRTALDLSPERLTRRLVRRSIEARFVTPRSLEVLLGRVEPGRLLAQAMASPAATPVSDLAPGTYLHHALRRSHRLSGAGERAGDWAWPLLAGLLVLLSMAVASQAPGVTTPALGAVYGAAALAGAAAMALEVALLLIYQAVYGLVWSHVGALAGAFMLGVVAGSWAGRSRGRGARPARGLCLALAAFAAYILLLAAALPLWAGLHAAVLFPLFFGCLGLGGFLLGLLYPLSLRSAPRLAGFPSALYGMDLAGAAVGGFLTSAVLLPRLGARGTLLAAGASLGLAAAVVALAGPREPVGPCDPSPDSGPGTPDATTPESAR